MYLQPIDRHARAQYLPSYTLLKGSDRGTSNTFSSFNVYSGRISIRRKDRLASRLLALNYPPTINWSQLSKRYSTLPQTNSTDVACVTT